MSDPPAEAAKLTKSVPATPELAFARFTEGLGTWWPPEFTWSQEVLESIEMESRPGGLCFERGPYGFRVDWARVLSWEPPHRLVLSWQIGPDRMPEPNPAKASQVEVRFVAGEAGTTEIELTHSGFDRHGEAAEGYRAAMTEHGWPRILERYAATLS